MKQVAYGLDFSEVKEWEEAVKSISRSETFEEDKNDPVKITDFLEMLAESVHSYLMKPRLKPRSLFKTIILIVRLRLFHKREIMYLGSVYIHCLCS